MDATSTDIYYKKETRSPDKQTWHDRDTFIIKFTQTNQSALKIYVHPFFI